MHDTALRLMPDNVPRHNAQRAAEEPDPNKAEAFLAIRDLLVGEERGDLDSLRDRIDRIERHEQDSELRRARVAEILADALEEASIRDGDRIGALLGPSIGEGIRHQIRTERPAMVAALVPMVGTLVTGAVGEAIDKVSRGVNERIERLFSIHGLKLVLRAKLSGSSINEVLLADLRRAEIERLYLFDGKANRLVFHWPDRDQTEERLEEHIADEILKRVLSLSGNMLGPSDHALRSIAIDDRHLVMRASDTHTVVIEVSGALSSERRADIGAACYDVLNFVSNLADAAPDADIDREVMTRFAARIVGKRKGAPTAAAEAEPGARRLTPAKVLGAALILGLLSAIGWRLYDAWRIETRTAAVEAELARGFAPATLMLSVTSNRGEGTIDALGVAFADVDPAALRARAASVAAPYTLNLDFVAADPVAASSGLERLDVKMGLLQQESRAAAAAVAALERKADAAVETVASFSDPARRLADWIAGNALFFSAGAEYRSTGHAEATLDALAGLLALVPDRRLRVIGYGDYVGPDEVTHRIAIERATTVAESLVERGIARERLIVVGRTGVHTHISEYHGAGSPNRRVEFELAFASERAAGGD